MASGKVPEPLERSITFHNHHIFFLLLTQIGVSVIVGPMIIAVGSINPVKLAATRIAFERVWPEQQWKVIGYQAESGVSAQPMSDQESIQGARQRAQQALHNNLRAKYGIGLEGGLQHIGGHWFDCGWIVVIDRSGIEGIGSTARIITPPSMLVLIKQGLELGDVVDRLFKTKNSKQADGHFGLMTNSAITRTSGYTDGVIMALARFIHPWLFEVSS